MIDKQAGPRTDRYLCYLIRLQQLSEEVDDIMAATSRERPYGQGFNDGFMGVRNRLELLKISLAFPLSDCREYPLILNPPDYPEHNLFG